MGGKVKRRVRRGAVYHDGNKYYFTGKSGTSEHYRCSDRLCSGRAIKNIKSKVMTNSQEHSQKHEASEVELDKQKAAAFARLREMVLSAQEGSKTIEIVREFRKELAPEVLAAVPNEESLSRYVRLWAAKNNVQLAKSTYIDFLVEEGLENTITLPQAPQVVVDGRPKPKPRPPELIFLKREGGLHPKVMIDDRIYLWSRDLGKGCSLYKCRERPATGCKVTLKVYAETKEYEIRGMHEHALKQQKPSNSMKKRSERGVHVVDEDGRELGAVSLDHVLTAGEKEPKLNLISGEAEPVTDPNLDSSLIPSDSDDADAAESVGDGIIDDVDHNDFPMDYDNEDEEDDSEPVLDAKSSTSTAIFAPRSSRGATRSGERCLVCGDELIISETLSSSEETFRKACRFLNVSSVNKSVVKQSNGCICDSCTSEVNRIHKLYNQVEEIQSLIFKKVERFEKKVVDAEIVDNWMAQAPAAFVKRVEAFRKEVLINYRNKLKLRREIRVERKLGNTIAEVRPSISANMYASDPSSRNTNVTAIPRACEQAIDSESTTLKRKRGRPKKSEKEADVHHQTVAMEDEYFNCLDDTNDEAIPIESEREVKFWENDPSKLQIDGVTDTLDGSVGDEGDFQDDNESEQEDSSDDEWKPDQPQSSSGSNKRFPGRRKTQNNLDTDADSLSPDNCVERQVEVEITPGVKTKVNQNTKAKSGKKTLNSMPKPVLTKEGRLFLSGFEIIKNAPGALKLRPYSISFTCGTCGKIVRTMELMREHICGHHLSMFKCTICDKDFCNAKSLQRHMDVKHLFTGETDPCSICGRPIRNRGNDSDMRYHIWTHLGEEERKDPQYKDYCPPHKRTPTQRIKSTYGRQTFMCSFCTKTFFQPAALRNHELTHTIGIQCASCGKVYHSKKRMYEHKQKCGPEAKEVDTSLTYPCPKCPALRFKSRATRSKHIRRFHKNAKDVELPFSCPKCPRCFSTRNAFKQHKRICSEGGSAKDGDGGNLSPSPAGTNVELKEMPMYNQSSANLDLSTSGGGWWQ